MPLEMTKATENKKKFRKSLNAYAWFFIMAMGGPMVSGTQSKVSGTQSENVSPVQAAESSAPRYPHELVMYYAGRGGVVTPKTPFSICTIHKNSDTKLPEFFKLLPLSPDQIDRIGLLDPVKNLTIPLHQFQMKKWKKLCKNSEDNSIDDDVALSISNKGSTPLKVTLPDVVTIPTFIFGENVVIENTAPIDSVIVGVDVRTFKMLSSGLSCYAENIVPSTVVFNGHLASGWVIQSDVGFNERAPQNLIVQHSRVLASGLKKAGDLKTVYFFGISTLRFQKKTVIDGKVSLGSDDEPFRSDPSDQPNNSIASLSNVLFQPKVITLVLPTIPKKGFFKINGKVDLSQTTLDIEWRLNGVNEDMLNRKILIIESNSPIVGAPKVELRPCCGYANPRVQARVEINGNNAYVVLSKTI